LPGSARITDITLKESANSFPNSGIAQLLGNLTPLPAWRPIVTKVLSIMPVLKVADLQRSVDWYTGVLGFQMTGRTRDDGDGEHCFIHADETELLLSTGSHLGATPSFTGTIYFRVVGVDSLFAKVSSRAEIVWPLEQQEYGTREFGFRDPDVYVLAFAEQSPASEPE